MPALSLLICGVFLSIPDSVRANLAESTLTEANWGIAVTVRTATIAYDTDDESVSSFVPMFFSDGERFFLEGLGGGMKVFKSHKFRADLFGRRHFVDIPKDLQNEFQADTIDFWGRLKFTPFDNFETDLEFLSDDHARIHGNLRATYLYHNKRLDLSPYAYLRYTTSDYNSYLLWI